MLSNAHKINLIRGQCRGNRIPWSITVTPDINLESSATPMYQNLKRNDYVIKGIFASLKEYEDIPKKLNEYETLAKAARFGLNEPVICNRHKLTEDLFVNVYNTAHFNFDNQTFHINNSDLFDGSNPLFTPNGHSFDLKSNYAKDVRNLMIKYDMHDSEMH